MVDWLGFVFLLELGPLINPLLSLLFLDAVAFLQLADEALAPAGDVIQVTIGKLSPLLLHGSFHLLPLTLDSVPVHNKVNLLPGNRSDSVIRTTYVSAPALPRSASSKQGGSLRSAAEKH